MNFKSLSLACFVPFIFGCTGLDLPEFHGVLGTNAPSELTRFAVTVSVVCLHHQLFQETEECGRKTQVGKVAADGSFTIPAMKGETSEWTGLDYSIQLDGKDILNTPYVHEDVQPNTLIDFLKNMTVVELGPYTVHFSTDQGIDFNDWISQQNENLAVGYWIDPQTNSGAAKNYTDQMNLALGDHPRIEMKTNDSQVSGVFLFPGSLADVEKNLKWNLVVNSVWDGDYDSSVLYQVAAPIQNAGVNSDSLSKPLLATHVINRDFGGTWHIDPQIKEFTTVDPQIHTSVTCTNGTLSGIVTYTYSNPTVAHLTHTDPVQGSCGNDHAQFEVKFTSVDDLDTSDPQNFKYDAVDAILVVSQITTNTANCRALDPTTQQDIGYAELTRGVDQ